MESKAVFFLRGSYLNVDFAKWNFSPKIVGSGGSVKCDSQLDPIDESSHGRLKALNKIP